jgi:hypothetical protein
LPQNEVFLSSLSLERLQRRRYTCSATPKAVTATLEGSGTPTGYSEKPDWMPVAPPNKFNGGSGGRFVSKIPPADPKPAEESPK